MTAKTKLILAKVFFLLLISLNCEHAWSQIQPGQDPQSATVFPKFYGDFVLASNFFEQGISISNSSFAMQPELGYEWTSAKIGFWGSNVQFPTNMESLNIRLFGWYDFLFSQTEDLKVRLDKSMYFKSNNRDGDLYHLDLNLSGHHLIAEQNTNWFGTGTRNLWLAYAKDWMAGADMDYKLEVGYNTITAISYNSYFAVKTGFSYKYYDFYYSLLINYNSVPTQFSNSIADLGLALQVEAKF